MGNSLNVIWLAFSVQNFPQFFYIDREHKDTTLEHQTLKQCKMMPPGAAFFLTIRAAEKGG